MKRAEGHYYGTRKVVYVKVSEPAHRGEAQKHFTVYGTSVAQVAKAIDRGLEKAFGKTSGGRKRGPRPKTRKV